MLTGYNTDVSYGGETFHVQTEDKGVNSPIILSLVYRAGTILAAKRTAYDNFIQNGVVDEVAVAQMLNKQHQILVAAIKSGKSEKLAELSRQQGARKTFQKVESAAVHQAKAPLKPTITSNHTVESHTQSKSLRTPVSVPGLKVEIVTPPAPLKHESRTVEAISFDQIIAGYLQNIPVAEQLRIEVLYPSRFRAGDSVTVRVAILIGGTNPTADVNVKLQILGTKIETQTWAGITDTQGLVSFQVKIPVFSSGAAALILKAQASNGQDAEAKFMITQK